MGKYRLLKWRSFAKERPRCSGIYICKIKNSLASIGLSYDKEKNTWKDDFDQNYTVTWWAFFPKLPEDHLELTSKRPSRRYTIRLTAEEISVYRENLSFILSSCYIPQHYADSIKSLHSCLKRYSE